MKEMFHYGWSKTGKVLAGDVNPEQRPADNDGWAWVVVSLAVIAAVIGAVAS